ncbi:MAG TPA: hypothetical protein VJ891_01345 [Casimicrobiaceae bacterium]|nr:hypothetical protein [Casimicrobiaceae bacterium]
MDSRDPILRSDGVDAGRSRGVRRIAFHALAMLLAAAIAWLVFAAYRQPDFILDFAGMRLC